MNDNLDNETLSVKKRIDKYMKRVAEIELIIRAIQAENETDIRD